MVWTLLYYKLWVSFELTIGDSDSLARQSQPEPIKCFRNSQLNQTDLGQVADFDGSAWTGTAWWRARRISPSLLAYLKTNYPIDPQVSYYEDKTTQAQYDNELGRLSATQVRSNWVWQRHIRESNVSRTIGDLDGGPIAAHHRSQAIEYRSLDRIGA
jgi:hypothetical protein